MKLTSLVLFACMASGAAFAQSAPQRILVVTADQGDYLRSAGGTIAAMIDAGARATLVRVGNDEKDSWKLTPEETALRARRESEEAAKILGVAEVHSLGYRSGELYAVGHTELRDRLTLHIRQTKPDVLFIPNPYAEYVEVLDRFYVGKAAEDAWRAAGLENFQPAHAAVGLGPHTTPEVYYYAEPSDPRRREPEAGAAFVPHPVQRDIASAFAKKLRALQALKTANESLAQRIKQRLDESGRGLPLLDTIDDGSIARLIEIDVRKLAGIAAEGTSYQLAEEFHYAGIEFQIPKRFLE